MALVQPKSGIPAEGSSNPSSELAETGTLSKRLIIIQATLYSARVLPLDRAAERLPTCHLRRDAKRPRTGIQFIRLSCFASLSLAHTYIHICTHIRSQVGGFSGNCAPSFPLFLSRPIPHPPSLPHSSYFAATYSYYNRHRRGGFMPKFNQIVAPTWSSGITRDPKGLTHSVSLCVLYSYLLYCLLRWRFLVQHVPFQDYGSSRSPIALL